MNGLKKSEPSDLMELMKLMNPGVVRYLQDLNGRVKRLERIINKSGLDRSVGEGRKDG